MSPYEYVHVLTQVIDAIGLAGGAVILGRGAHLLLRADQAFRVGVIAPFENRVATIASREGLDPAAARRRVMQVDEERKAFLRRCFHVLHDDPAVFDLVVNTGALGLEGATTAICAAVQALPVEAGRIERASTGR